MADLNKKSKIESYKNMSWEEQLQKGITSIDRLDKYTNLSSKEKERLSKIIDMFPVLITPYYASIINWDDPKDPIKKIIMPSEDEFSEEGFFDPSDEKSNTVLSSLQHKYSNTAIILSTSNCAGYCRFCFRRRLKEKDDCTTNKEAELNKFFEYIKKHPEIDNVIITGGDSLILPNQSLDYILSEIRKIKHVKMIRIATRVPVFLPQRISQDKELIEILSKHNLPDKQIYVVTHFNHPNEITDESIKALKALIDNGIQVKSQTVLLRGINDNPEILAKLFNTLAHIGIAPYYLFQCRPVIRSSHFKVPIYEGWKIFEEAKKKLSGLAKTARYVMSHATGKIEICGIDDNKVYLKYIQAKNYDDIGKFIIRKLPKNKEAYWFNDLWGESTDIVQGEIDIKDKFTSLHGIGEGDYCKAP